MYIISFSTPTKKTKKQRKNEKKMKWEKRLIFTERIIQTKRSLYAVYSDENFHLLGSFFRLLQTEKTEKH